MSFREFGPLISSRSPALRSALSALAGFDAAKAAAKAARAAVSQRMGVLSTSEQAEQVLLDEVLDALRASKPLPADLGADAVNARAADQRLVAERMLLTRAVEQLDGAVAEPLRGDLTPAFRSLHEQLTAFLVDVPALAAKLDGIADPVAAIDADLGSEWKCAQLALSRYRDIRDAQRSLVRVTVRNITDQYRLTVHDLIRNATEVFPDWRIWSQSGYRVNTVTGERSHLSPPWPGDLDSWEFLVWLATSDAQPWVPTPAQRDEVAHKAAQDPEVEPYTPMRLEQREPAGELVDPARLNKRKAGVR